MSCSHAVTTVAWLYGEAPEEHLHHVAVCAECQAVADAHERVAYAVSGVAPALRTARTAPRRGWWVAGGLAAAAAALLVAWSGPPRGVADTDPDGQAAAPYAAFADEEVDVALDDLEADLDAFTAELDAF